MTDDASFPAHPFWNYSLVTYAKPGVADACILLQDEFGLNVNLLLVCLWSGAEGPGRLASERIRECINGTRDWQERVVKPLRAVRRYSKSEPTAIPDTLRKIFRPDLLAVELDAEHVEQLAIAEIVKPATDKKSATTDRSSQQRCYDAIQNLLAYLAIEDVVLEEHVSRSLLIIVGAAFPEADLTALVEN
jgi:uncharacterized protein (TIGR02444 family)